MEIAIYLFSSLFGYYKYIGWPVLSSPSSPLPCSLRFRPLSRSLSSSPSPRAAAKALCLRIYKMNCYAMQQNALAACEEIGGAFAADADRKHPVICPRPRRLVPIPLPPLAVPARPVPRLPGSQLDLSDLCDSEAGAELIGIFLRKGGEEEEGDRRAASSPSFFCGSPPSRVSNPIVMDSRFREDRPQVPLGHFPAIQTGSPMPARKGCTPAKFSYEQAAVRVEGFDCLNSDRRSCSSIAAVA